MQGDLEQLAAQLQALAHPLRLRILAAIGDGRASPMQLAAGPLRAHASLSNLSYHFRALAQAGLLLPDGEEPRRGSVEHFYVASPDAKEWIARLGVTPEGDDPARESS